MYAWVPDETSLAGREHLDPDYVRAYDQKTRLDVAEIIDSLRQLGLSSDSTLVDLGAGTGTVALAAATLCHRVVAVDPSPVMVATITERRDTLGLDNVDCVQAGFLSYQHVGEPPEFVFSRNALHHLPDFWKAVALTRIAKLLPPGGVFSISDLVFSFQPDQTQAAVEAWLSGAPDDPADGWTRAELEQHLRDEHSTFTWLLEPMIERAGLCIIEVEYSKDGVFAYYACVKPDLDRVAAE